MEQFEKVCKGLECLEGCKTDEECKRCPYQPYRFGHCKYDVMRDAIALIRQQQERIGELEKYRRLQVHNIGNVDIPDGVTMEQFCEIMDGVIKALEHTEKGESWPYKPPKEEEHAAD